MERTRIDLFKPHTAQVDSVEGLFRIVAWYGAQWNEVGRILQSYWHILTRSSKLEAIVGPRQVLVAK